MSENDARSVRGESRIRPEIGHEQEKEINVLDYLIVILKYKWLIGAVMVFAVLSTVFFYTSRRQAPTLPPIYHAECTLQSMVEPQLLDSALKSYSLFTLLVDRKAFLPILFPERWDSKAMNWVGGNPPSLGEAFERWGKMLNVKWKESIVNLSLESADKETASQLMKIYLDGVHDIFQQKEDPKVAIIKESMETLFAKQKAAAAQIKEKYLRGKIEEFITKSLKTAEGEMKALRPRTFEVIDAPFVIERRVVSPTSSPSPARIGLSKILSISIVLSLLVGILLAFLVEYLRNMAKKYPEKMSDIKRYLKP